MHIGDEMENKERETFEKLPEINAILQGSEFGFNESINQYYHPNHTEHRLNYAFLMGAWSGWQAKTTPEGFVLELEKGRFVQYELIDLLTRSLNSSKVLKTNTNWVHVVRMLNVGSTVAHRICEKLGVDPESTKFEAQEQSHD